MTITIREIKENIFYVNEKQKESKQGMMVRKVTVGNFNTKHNNYFYRRLLACIIILKSSKKIQEDYPDLFEDIIKRLGTEGFPDALDNLKKLDEYVKYNRNNIDDTQVPKPVAYVLFMLISFYNLNNLLNDFYIIFNRTFAYEKEQLQIQDWYSLVTDDFLLSILIWGLDELELYKKPLEYFQALQKKYIEKKEFYKKIILDKEPENYNKFKQHVDLEEFFIEQEDKALLETNEIFMSLKSMTLDDRREAEELILSLFVFSISAELQRKIYATTIHGNLITRKKLSLPEAIENIVVNVGNNLLEYENFQPLEHVYRYIDEEIVTLFTNENIKCRLKPLLEA